MGWRRLEFTSDLPGEASPVKVGVELEPSAVVDLFGAQVEPQVSAGAYKKTAARGGLYQRARYDDDQLAVTAEGFVRYSARVRLVSPAEG